MGPKVKEESKKPTKSKSVAKTQKPSVTPKRVKKSDTSNSNISIQKKLESSRFSRKPEPEKKKVPDFMMRAARSGSNKNKEKKEEKKPLRNNLKDREHVMFQEDSKEHIDLVNSIPEKAYNDDDYSKSEYMNITPNINGINRVLNSSDETLKEQRKILERFTEVNAKLSNSEFDVQRLSSKLENDDLTLFNDKYSDCLRQVIEKLKNHNEELEGIKSIKEENKNLRYKLELWSIDKNDSELSAEIKFTSVKNFLTNEMNTFNEFIVELGYESLSSDKLRNNKFDEDTISNYFQGLKKIMKSMKGKFDCLNVDNQNLIEEIKFFKAKVGNNHKKNLHSDPNMQYHLNQQMEEELNYYRNVTKDLEEEIKDLKSINRELISDVKKTQKTNHFNRNNEVNNDVPLNNNKYNSSQKYKEQEIKNDFIKKEENFNLEKNNSRDNIDSFGDHENNNRKGKIYEYTNRNLDNNNENEPKAIYEENEPSRNLKNINHFDNYEENEPKAIYEENEPSRKLKNLDRFDKYEENEPSRNLKNFNRFDKYKEKDESFNKKNNNNYISENKYSNNYLESFRRNKDKTVSDYNPDYQSNLNLENNYSVYNISNDTRFENKYNDSNYYNKNKHLYNSNTYDYSG